MLDQEKGVPYISEQRFLRRLGASDISVEVNIKRRFTVRGGILGDAVGYGKTACMIALVRETRGRTFTGMKGLLESEKAQADKRVFTNATLIIVPKNLFDQWAKEIDKFSPDLKVVAIGDFTKLKKLSVADLMKADVVLVSFSFFFSDAYQKAIDREVYDVSTKTVRVDVEKKRYVYRRNDGTEISKPTSLRTYRQYQG